MSNGNSAVSVTIDAPLQEKEKNPHSNSKEPAKVTWTTMTPQQISMWIDK